MKRMTPCCTVLLLVTFVFVTFWLGCGDDDDDDDNNSTDDDTADDDDNDSSGNDDDSGEGDDDSGDDDTGDDDDDDQAPWEHNLPFEDDFDDEALGGYPSKWAIKLTGEGNSNVDVSSNESFSNPYSLRMACSANADSGTEARIRLLDNPTKLFGETKLYFSSSMFGRSAVVLLGEVGTEDRCSIKFKEDSKYYFECLDSSAIELGSYTTDMWYDLKFWFDGSDHSIEIELNGVNSGILATNIDTVYEFRFWTIYTHPSTIYADNVYLAVTQAK